MIHQSGCSRPAFGSLENGYWLYSQAYCEVSVIVVRVAAVDRDVQRRGDAAAGRRVRDAVAHGDRVGRARQRELDVLARRSSLTAVRPDASAGSVYAARAGADDRAVGRGVLGLLLDEVDAGAAAGDQRRVERGAGDAGPVGRVRRWPCRRRRRC